MKSQVITACARIHFNFEGIYKVFLAKRAAIKKFLPGIYELPGGHIEMGEDIVAGLQREIKEEFGMQIRVGDPFYVFTYTNNVQQSHAVEVIYLASFVGNISAIQLNPSDHESYGWLSEDEIQSITAQRNQQEDPEIKATYKAFSILKGAPIEMG